MVREASAEDPGAAAAGVAAGAGGLAAGRRTPSSRGSGPTLEFSRRARAVAYEPRTLADYKAMQPKEGAYVELGRLGPDLSSEDLAVKHEQRRKAREYARGVRKTAKRAVSRKRPGPADEERSKAKEAKARPSARTKALDFAKSRIPAPRRKPKSGAGTLARDGSGPGAASRAAPVRSELEALEAEHDKFAAAVAGIRRLV